MPRKPFWEHTTPDENGCLIWHGVRDHNGYGKWNHTGAHREAYRYIKGAIPPGLQLDHLCRNRACVNPEHLEPVTVRENTLRGNTLAAANVAKRHCPRGHPYDEQNTYVCKNGARRCRTCRRERSTKRAAELARSQPR